jgi:hypothetical protein
VQLRRHAPLGRHRLPLDTVRGTNSRVRQADIFSDADAPRGGRRNFRWMFSTALAGAVGAISVAAVVLGSGDRRETEVVLREILAGQTPIAAPVVTQSSQGLRWAVQKSDRLVNMSSAIAGRFLVHDTMRISRNKRDVIVNKSFVRLMARLTPVAPFEAERVPPFNPYRLYATPGQSDDGTAQNVTDDTADIATRVTDLLGQALPLTDGQELDNADVAEIVLRIMQSQDDGQALAATTGIRGSLKEGTRRPRPRRSLSARCVPALIAHRPTNPC